MLEIGFLCLQDSPDNLRCKGIEKACRPLYTGVPSY